jgi:uncharacterized membrane protein YoaK (UPF0700 family)
MLPIKNILNLALSFIAGYVDTAGFIALSGIFTAHVTGNLVLAGASLNNTYPGASIYQLLLIPVFMFGVAVTALVINIILKNNKSPLNLLFLIQGVLLFLFSISDTIFSFGINQFCITNNIIISGSIGVLAMAMQNAYMRLILENQLPTTVMTGNITLFSIEITAYIKSHLLGKLYDTSTLKKVSLPVFGFLSGSIIGAIAVLKFGLICIVLPSILLFFIPLFFKNNLSD